MCRVYPSSKCHRAELLLSCKVDGWIMHYGFYAQSVCRNCSISSTLPLQFIFITLKRSSIPLHSRDKCASVVTICVRPAILVASTMPTTHVRTTADTMTLRLQKTKNAHRFANPNYAVGFIPENHISGKTSDASPSFVDTRQSRTWTCAPIRLFTCWFTTHNDQPTLPFTSTEPPPPPLSPPP